jgi:methionine-rich copper-binding protein CopC
MCRSLSGLVAAMLLTVLSTSAFAPSAFAHARLRASAPAADSAGPAPKELAITFSEALELKFSSVAVTDAAGARVDRDDLHAVGDNARELVIGLKSLTPGVYVVDWHATSVDTHKTDGRYSFTVVK